MAQALAAGLAASGALQPGQIGACARDRAKLHRNTKPHGFLAFDDAAGVAGFADVVVVAVKPYQVEAVLAPVKGMLAGKVVVSVAAGMTFDRYEEILAPGTHHLSTIPNTPVAVCEGIVVCERRHSLSEAEWQSVQALLSHVGLVVTVDTAQLGIAGTVCGAARPSWRCSSRRWPTLPSSTASCVPMPTAWPARWSSVRESCNSPRGSIPP